MKPLRLLRVAETEIREACGYYETEAPGLGSRFLSELDDTLALIRQFPDAWSLFSGRTRRALVRRFHYGVLYQHREDEILIIAVAHLHRDPVYWQKRLKEQKN